jgi:hypothetical protein
MSCCGQMRAQQRRTSSPFVHELAPPRPSATGRFPMGTATFEYTGPTAITAVGRATGRQYRFSMPGLPVLVDARDRWSLAKVPRLREIR